MTKSSQIWLGSAIIIVLVLILGSIKFFQIQQAMARGAKQGPPPVTVSVIKTKHVEWQKTLHSVGTLKAYKGVTIRSEEPGTVAAIYFESGHEVEKGARLIDLDTSVEQAQLDGAKANSTLKIRALERARQLRASRTISEQDLDTAQAEADAAAAEVLSLQAVINRKRIVAPFAGTLGIREITLGEYISPGTPLVPLYDLSKLYVDFNLPENAALVLKTGLPIELQVDAIGFEKVEGVIEGINPQISEETRTVVVRASVNNSNKSLRPGMFAAVTVILPESEKVIVLPSSSIQYAPYGDAVYVVEASPDQADDKLFTVRQQIVELGSKRGSEVAILKGLKPDETVVAIGTFQLQPGSKVLIDNTAAPTLNQPASVENS